MILVLIRKIMAACNMFNAIYFLSYTLNTGALALLFLNISNIDRAQVTFAMRSTLVIIFQRNAFQNPTDVFILQSGVAKCRETELDKSCTSILRTSVLKCRETEEDGSRTSVPRSSALMCQKTDLDN